MSQSLTKLFVHIVFHIHSQSSLIRKDEQQQLYAYINAIIDDNDSVPITIGGTSDHIHIMCIMSKNIACAKLIEEIKRHSSRWIKTKHPHYRDFKWQGGYAAFSVSVSLYDTTVNYINNQEEHHKTVNFRDELISFFEKYGVQYDDRYAFSD